MNLRISALEKVARIGCKYELSFLLYSLWALPSGGLTEGQLAVILLLVLKSGPRDSDWEWDQWGNWNDQHSQVLKPDSSVNLCRPSNDTGIVFEKMHSLNEPNHCSSLNCSM